MVVNDMEFDPPTGNPGYTPAIPEGKHFMTFYFPFQPDTVMARLKKYEELTKPLIEYYRYSLYMLL